MYLNLKFSVIIPGGFLEKHRLHYIFRTAVDMFERLMKVLFLSSCMTNANSRLVQRLKLHDNT